MKKIYKRIIALMMSIAMTSSFSTVALAAETEGNTTAKISEISAYTADGEPITLSADYGTLVNRSGQTDEYTIYVTFSVPEGGAYLYFLVQSNAMGTVSMYKNNTRVWNRYLSMTGDKTRTMQIVFDYDPDASFWAGGDYQIQVKFNAKDLPYAFAVFASPYILDV